MTEARSSRMAAAVLARLSPAHWFTPVLMLYEAKRETFGAEPYHGNLKRSSSERNLAGRRKSNTWSIQSKKIQAARDGKQLRNDSHKVL
jgi:hypothetical protein